MKKFPVVLAGCSILGFVITHPSLFPIPSEHPFYSLIAFSIYIYFCLHFSESEDPKKVKVGHKSSAEENEEQSRVHIEQNNKEIFGNKEFKIKNEFKFSDGRREDLMRKKSNFQVTN